MPPKMSSVASRTIGAVLRKKTRWFTEDGVPWDQIDPDAPTWRDIPVGPIKSAQLPGAIVSKESNYERPHEALEQEVPASAYRSSPRPMPSKLPPLEYPDRYEVRYVSANGGTR